MGADKVRVTQDTLRGTSVAAPGRVFHLDVGSHGFGIFSSRPRDEPLTNMFLILAEQAFNASDTGGSLTLVPSSKFWEFGNSPCSSRVAQRDWSEDPEGHPECMAWLNARAVTLDVALGDVVFYSSSLPHKSQPMRHGDRINYGARFINMDGLAEKLADKDVCRRPLHTCDGTQVMAWDRLGLHSWCSDWSQGVHEYDLVWPSVYTFGVTKSTSACKPQVFPRPLEHEVAARHAGHVRNHMATGNWRSRAKSYRVLTEIYNKVMMSSTRTA